MVHELAKLYGVATQSYDSEPRRHVDLFRTANSGMPALRLSEAAAAGVEPAPRAEPREWQVTLLQVECSEGSISAMLRAHSGNH